MYINNWFTTVNTKTQNLQNQGEQFMNAARITFIVHEKFYTEFEILIQIYKLKESF